MANKKINKGKSIEEILSENDMKFVYSFLSGMLIERIFKIFEEGDKKEGGKHGKGKSEVKRKQGNK